MSIGIYAGSTVAGMTILPSPVEAKRSKEIIWSQDTGRTVGSNAKMIGDIIAEKETFQIRWGVLTEADFNSICTALTYIPDGFFYFAMADTLAHAKSNAKKFYRSEIQGDPLPIGDTLYYNNVSVSVIEQ